MRRSLTILLLIGLVAAILWWLAQSSGADSGDSTDSEQAGRPRAAAAAPPGGGLASSAEPDAELQRQNAETADPDAPPAGAADPGATFRVRVVRGEDGSPVPGAEVLYMDLATVEQKAMRAAMEHHDDTEKVFEELGVLYPAGADGIAELPLPPGSIWIAARHEERYGTVWGMTRANLAEVLEIRIVPAIHVRVHVEDETQKPLAGVPVAYMTGDGFDSHANARTETDERGDAELRHLETVMTDYGRQQRNRIVALLPGAEPPGADFAPENPPREPVRIVVPRCGSVLVEVLDLAGALVGDGIGVTLQGALSAEQRDEWKERTLSEFVGQRDGLGAQTAWTTAGRAHFPHVPIGRRLECFASPDRSSAHVSVTADGPLRPGEEVRIRLQQDAAHPLLTGRIVTADGSPLAGITLMSTYWRGWPHHAGTRQGNEYRPLDTAGRFSKTLDEAAVPPGTGRVLALHRTLDDASHVEMGWVFVPEEVADSGHDAGDVRIGGPVAVAGRVEKADGSPVARAWLHLRGWIGPADEPATTNHQELTDFIWRTDADGRFSLEGELPGINHHLEVSGPEGGTHRYVPFEPGTSDLRVVLEESGSIQGRLIVDAGIPANLVYVDFVRTDPVKDGMPAMNMDWPEAVSGAFASPQILPGTWSVKVRTRETNETLATVEGLPVRDGEATEDPRLQIDLRGRLHLHRLTVLDADGRRPDPIDLYLPWNGQWMAVKGANPRAFLTTEPSLRGFVSAAGCGRSAVSFPGGEVEVRLERGIPVRIELTGAGLAELERGLSFNLLGAGDGAAAPQYHHSVPLQAPWSVATGVPEPGDYRVQLHYHSPSSDQHPYGLQSTLRFPAGGDYEFRVGPGPEEQHFRVEITQEMAAAAIAAANPR